jgi:protein phosphatase 1 regulatory subunit 7
METETNNNNTQVEKKEEPVVQPEDNDSSDNEGITEEVKELGPEFLADVSLDSEDLDLTHTQISNLDKININRFTLLKTLSLRQNVITKISGLDKLVNLEELDLYDNRIKHIENLDT